ncbi:hypothetical protein SDC9_86180 [bioreactor metagenome]|uniref:Uncharacterized protein n=1 Tax=bioreactor metagenome TaxID=1076179 RepID=A0A644ZFC6_9ZZZZ
MVLPWSIKCIWNVRHLRHNVDRSNLIYIRIKKCVDSMALARVESSLRNGIPRDMDATIKCNDWSRVDTYSL